MKKIILAFIVLFAVLGGIKAQTNTLYFMEDVPLRHSMNPAFMPTSAWYIGLPSYYFEIGNSALMLRDFVFKQNNTWTTAFSPRQSIEQLYKRIGSNMNTDMRFAINLINFGFRVNYVNYFSFDMSVKAESSIYTPRDLTRLLLFGTGEEDSFDFKKTGAEAMLYGELALGYSRKFNDKWTAGLKIKGLVGFAGIHTDIDNMSLYASGQRWNVDVKANMYVMAPGMTRNANGSFNFDTSDWRQMIKPNGYGAAIDLGATFKPIENLTLSAAVTDLGFISWNKNNVANLNVNGSFSFEGVEFKHNYTADSLRDNFNKLWDNMRDSVRYTTSLGTNSRINQRLTTAVNVGAEYGILNNKISFAALGNIRMNYDKVMPEFTLGVNFRPANWFKAYLSHTYAGRFSSSIGAGVNIQLGPVNMFLISDFIPLSYVRLQNTETLIADANTRATVERISLPYRNNRYNVQAGLIFSFGKNSSDRDRDGVSNSRDKCPDTDIKKLMAMCPDKKRTEFVDKDGCTLDEDKDGVADCYDKCPNTQINVAVDEHGCPLDQDKDGVYDYLDLCPDTPEGVTVDGDGCPLDSDGDGVPDYLDKCPGTPQGVRVDADGCPLDSDGDGVTDDKDKCPDTPQGVAVDIDGCPKDSDGDGVPDYKDKCPNTPKEIIGFVDEHGCPKDTDGDGILDYKDECPTIKGVPENKGCPPVKKEVLKVFKQALHGIQFDTAKSTIKPVSFGVLKLIVDIMKNNPDYNLIIAGHTDSQGNDDYNMNLSEKRAAAVRQYLINNGVSADRLQSKGYGETRPVATNATAKGRAQNRRVEFTVVFEKLVEEDK